MSYNAYIVKKMEADKYLALLLDKSIKEIGKEAVKQVGLIHDGIERASWYLSCFSKNYKDVCEKLRTEDIRFLKAILKITPNFRLNLPHVEFQHPGKIYNHSDIYIKDNVIEYMLEVFTEDVFSEVHYERKMQINKILFRLSAGYVTVNFANRSIAYAVASAIYMSAGLRIAIEGAITSIAKKGASAFGIYGYVKAAADAANRLKLLNGSLYSKFYSAEIEMLYFLIESVVTKIEHKFRYALSDEEIANDIMRLIK